MRKFFESLFSGDEFADLFNNAIKGDNASFRELMKRIKADPALLDRCQQLMKMQPPPGAATSGEQFMLLTLLNQEDPSDSPITAELKRQLMIDYLDAAIKRGNSLAMVEKAGHVLMRDDQDMLLKYEAIELLRKAADLKEPEALKVLNSPNFEVLKAQLLEMESSLPPKQSPST